MNKAASPPKDACSIISSSLKTGSSTWGQVRTVVGSCLYETSIRTVPRSMSYENKRLTDPDSMCQTNVAFDMLEFLEGKTHKQQWCCACCAYRPLLRARQALSTHRPNPQARLMRFSVCSALRRYVWGLRISVPFEGYATINLHTVMGGNTVWHKEYHSLLQFVNTLVVV